MRGSPDGAHLLWVALMSAMFGISQSPRLQSHWPHDQARSVDMSTTYAVVWPCSARTVEVKSLAPRLHAEIREQEFER